eukprot:TRINITY_DN13526_c0_g1_i1.p1 TRINITY_DN13526_c0_g1~~TRINITY_DN13526_c0_g1_i1.p1  ORF type:complete len:310 (+),score=35.28 TRINITY_DN13526_c0_g1_i1:155-1084(+)
MNEGSTASNEQDGVSTNMKEFRFTEMKQTLVLVVTNNSREEITFKMKATTTKYQAKPRVGCIAQGGEAKISVSFKQSEETSNDKVKDKVDKIRLETRPLTANEIKARGLIKRNQVPEALRLISAAPNTQFEDFPKLIWYNASKMKSRKTVLECHYCPPTSPEMRMYEEMSAELKELQECVKAIVETKECQWCELNVDEYQFCPLTGVRHITSEECKVLMKDTFAKFPFPEAVLKKFPVLVAVLQFHAFSHLFRVPVGALEEATIWLKQHYIRLLAPEKFSQSRELTGRAGVSLLPLPSSLQRFTQDYYL